MIMQKWEYMSVDFNWRDQFLTGQLGKLNQLGQDGWEVIVHGRDMVMPTNAFFMLKRPIENLSD